MHRAHDHDSGEPLHRPLSISVTGWPITAQAGGDLEVSIGDSVRLSGNAAEDLVYIGSFPAGAPLAWLDHSAGTGRILLTREKTPRLEFYSDSTYQPLGSLPLADFLDPSEGAKGRRIPSEPKMVFANRDGSRAYVLMRAQPKSQRTGKWAIQAIETKNLQPLP